MFCKLKVVVDFSKQKTVTLIFVAIKKLEENPLNEKGAYFAFTNETRAKSELISKFLKTMSITVSFIIFCVNLSEMLTFNIIVGLQKNVNLQLFQTS